ncbi:ScbA/BarX family gamma-butyrolactone biosynthesis protein [Streptomyces sp. H27-D2]|uniref:ScbA/BarX family gamma-butyrolactone biosynthesis protein n=1 Tax=Streptomyces sp. H27-D2 TaxID=3046304 RepID=UPI002DBEDDA2|nr:ScbA/BarX family gamma-butyrolactone biosynthesis protein [Streptomyces sp. H27-D2]MEC4015040.1 ScbA/BarX family gamma-butyrolactone biosynthesis protein [Streptomyces sp. H27-D2]
MDQAFTHKTNAEEVLLKSWQRTGDDTFTVIAQWPRTHRFYTSRNGLHDPLLLTETIRQTLPLLSHSAYGVPFGHQLMWHDFAFDIRPEATYDDGDPADVALHITCSDVTYRRKHASAVTLSVEVERAGRQLATARSRFTIQDRAVYNRLRGPYADIAAANARALPLPPPAAMTPFGRDRFEDVALASTDRPRRWQLRTDTAHPIFFDHLVDHTPGMLLLEAARQAALATAYPAPVTVTGMDSVFSRYAELDVPCWVTAEPLTDSGSSEHGSPPKPFADRVRITAEQNDREIFSSLVTLAPIPAQAPVSAAAPTHTAR